MGSPPGVSPRVSPKLNWNLWTGTQTAARFSCHISPDPYLNINNIDTDLVDNVGLDMMVHDREFLWNTEFDPNYDPGQAIKTPLGPNHGMYEENLLSPDDYIP